LAIALTKYDNLEGNAMDPLTAFGMASTAFGAIKTAFEHGREIESMISDIGRWSNAVYDVESLHQKEKRRANRFASIEEEALETFLYKQRIKEQENELRTMVNMRFGPTAWQEILNVQAQIRKDRIAAREKAQQERDQFLYNAAIWACGGGIAFLVLGLFYTIITGMMS